MLQSPAHGFLKKKGSELVQINRGGERVKEVRQSEGSRKSSDKIQKVQ